MEYLNYKKFQDPSEAESLAQLLNENNIVPEIAETKDKLDSLYGTSAFNANFIVKLKKEDFAKADSLLESLGQQELASVDQGHYLYQFSNEELLEVLSKPDEWNALDFQLAKKILKERGKEVSDQEIVQLKKRRIDELAKSEDSSIGWIVFGYVSAFLGGLLGIYLGLSLATSKKTLPNGQQVYTYSAGHRKQGTQIFILGVIMFIVWVIVVAIEKFSE